MFLKIFAGYRGSKKTIGSGAKPCARAKLYWRVPWDSPEILIVSVD
jgi:hypothetical protein